MDFEEDVLDSQNSSVTGQNYFNKPVRDKFSKIVIGEDLQRAIAALQSVPKVNWSLDSSYDDNRNGLASAEYIWKAFDLPESSSFDVDWQPVTQEMVAGQTKNQSEILRKDSFTISSKRLDLTSDNKCKLVEETATSVQMSLCSREKRGKANTVGEKPFGSSPSDLATSITGIEVTKKPPPLPPKPAHLQCSKNKQLVTGKLALQGKRILRGAGDLRKTDTSLDVMDIYERSLDVLEKDESDQELEDLTTTRSDSPECLLEELLDSVPAEEFDTSECQNNPSTVNSNNREAAKTHLLCVENLEKRSSRTAKLDDTEDAKKYAKVREPKYVLMSSAETESRSHIDSVKHEPINILSLKLVDANIKSANKELAVSAIKRKHTPQIECPSSSAFAGEQTNESSVTEAGDRELTPENIFEEIMDSLETHQDDQSGAKLLSSSEIRRPQKPPQHEPNRRSACDYLLENEWLSIYCDQLQAEEQHETITETQIGERTSEIVTNTGNSNSSSKSSTGKTVSQSEQILGAPENPTATLMSKDTKTNITSQDTMQAEVLRKPVPPLRETVQTFTKKDFLLYDIKLAPATDPRPLTPRKNPKTFTNDSSVNSCLNSFAELMHEPVTAAHEASENRRPVDTSSSAACHDENNKKYINTGERTNTPEFSLNINESGSLSKDRIATILTRESELPECDEYEEEMDLDLETELNRNLDACTASDVECQSIDKLMTSESLLSSDVKVITRPKKSNSLRVKVPGKLGGILAKKKLKKTQKTPSVEQTAEVVWSHRDEPVNSNQENATDSTFGQYFNNEQTASDNISVKASPIFSENNLRDLNNFETSKTILRGFSKDSEVLNSKETPQESSIDAANSRTVVATSVSDIEENHNQAIMRNVRSVEKENTAGREKQQELQVMSEEVTSQEIVLKIVWPKRELKNQSKVRETGKPPFRELQLKRVIRISDLDNPLNVLPKVPTSQPVLAVTQQPSKVHRQGGLASVSISTRRTNNTRDSIPTDQTVAIRNSSDAAVEYESQANCQKLEHISDSTIGVHQKDTVKVLRVPMPAVHKVQDIKNAVASVESTILDDFKRQPKKRNIRVTCDAVESRSRSSLHDRDVTVIRNTIVDTYEPKSEQFLSSEPATSV